MSKRSQSVETESEDSEASLVATASKKAKCACRWQPDWKRYFLSKSSRGDSYAYCTICRGDFSVASGGLHEVKRHVESKKHKEYLSGAANQPNIASSFARSSCSTSDQVTIAETYFSMFIAEHNLPFMAADHFSKLCKVMFPDSKIASEYSSGRTKATAIVKHALAPTLNLEVVDQCISSPFTILCDGGNDQLEKKYFAVMVRFWCETACQAITRFLAMPVCNVSTAAALFEALENELESRHIPWSNLIGYASDTASVMVGAHNSVLSRIRIKQPKVFSLGCLCHLASLCSVAALKKLPVSIDELLIDIYYHFKHSAKRYSEFMEILHEFEEIKPLRLLKHCTTRWLSLQRCVKRLIDQWPALYCYFDQQVSSTTANARMLRIASQLKNPEVKLFCHFVLYAMKPFNKFSTAFQTHASRIGTIQSDVRQLLYSYMSNFVEPDILKSEEDITIIDYKNRSCQLDDSELGVGTSTRLLLCGELEDEVIGTRIEVRFFEHVRLFYETSVSKMLAKFPFSDNTLKELSFLDPRNRDKCSRVDVLQLASRFTSFNVDEMDDLTLEFSDYRAARGDSLPEFDHHKVAAIDRFWAAMSHLKAVADSDTLRFGTLSKLAKVVLVLPHSNADPERLFSMVRKIQTELRRNLDPSTVCDLLSVKINNDNVCYENKHLMNDSLIVAAKQATRKSLQST